MKDHPFRPVLPARPAVLVIGGSGGIGGAICRAFGQAGWHVGIHYCFNKASAEETLQDVIAAQGTGGLHQADVRDPHSVQRMAAVFVEQTPSALSSVLIYAAGIGAGSLLPRQGEADWADMMAINLTGVFHCLQAIAPHFMERGHGSMVVIGSRAGFGGVAGQAAYAASKAGLIGLVRSAALEWGGFNIRINLVLPGWQRTSLSQGAFPEQAGWKDHALGRPPSCTEVASTVLHLAQLKDVSGQVWNCDSRHLQ
jgi:3-oxoacyl-[acyl-carrier protein] reductase